MGTIPNVMSTPPGRTQPDTQAAENNPDTPLSARRLLIDRRLEGVATVFELSGGHFGEMHTLARIDYSDGGVNGISDRVIAQRYVDHCWCSVARLHRASRAGHSLRPLRRGVPCWHRAPSSLLHLCVNRDAATPALARHLPNGRLDGDRRARFHPRHDGPRVVWNLVGGPMLLTFEGGRVSTAGSWAASSERSGAARASIRHARRTHCLFRTS